MFNYTRVFKVMYYAVWDFFTIFKVNYINTAIAILICKKKYLKILLLGIAVCA